MNCFVSKECETEQKSAGVGDSFEAERGKLRHARKREYATARLKLVKAQMAEKQREIADYKAEAIRVIRGESKFSDELLNTLIEQAKEEESKLAVSYSLLRYINSYEDYTQFKAIELSAHTEYFNTYCLEEMNRAYSEL